MLRPHVTPDRTVRGGVLILVLVVAASCQTWRLRELTREVDTRTDRGEYREVERAGEDLAALAQRSPDIRARVRAFTSAAKLKRHLGHPEEAKNLDALALRDAESVSPPDPALLARPHMGLGITHKALGALAESAAELELAVQLYEQAPLQGNSDYVIALRNLAATYGRQGRRSEAIALSEKAWEAASANLAESSAEGVRTALELARVYENSARHNDAGAMYAEAERRLHRSPEATRRDAAFLFQDRAMWYHAQGRYREAERDFADAIAAFEFTLGADNFEVAFAKGRLCEVKAILGAYAEAIELCGRALQIFERMGPTRALEVHETLSFMGTISEELGNIREAEAYYKRARSLLEARSDRSDAILRPTTALAQLYLKQGALDESTRLIEEAVNIARKTVAPDHDDADAVLLLRSRVALLSGETDRAIPFYTQAIRREDGKHKHFNANLAVLLEDLAQWCPDPCPAGDRLELARRAVLLKQNAFGENHPSIAGALHALGIVQQARGNNVNALSVFRQVAAMNAELLGPLHPETTKAQYQIARSQASIGRFSDALATFDPMEAAEEDQLRAFLGVVSEARQRAFLVNARDSLDFIVSLQQHWLPRSLEAQRVALRTLLRRKARALELTAAQLESARRGSGSGESPALIELRAVRANRAALILRGPGVLSVDLYRERVRELGERERELDARLAEQGPQASGPPVTLEGVGAQLLGRSALLEIVRYEPFEGGRRARYAAYALKDCGRQITAIDIGDARAVERQILRLRSALSVPGGDVRVPARALDRKLLEPLDGFLRDVDHVYVAPDGAFHLVPFAALVDARGAFRLGRWEFSYLGSGRELLPRPARTPVEAQSALVLGGPQFDARVEARAVMQRPDVAAGPAPANSLSRDYRRKGFAALPAARAEAEQVARRLGVVPLLGAEVTEEGLKAAQSPAVLHIATHAFFLKDLPTAHVLQVPSGGESLPVVSQEEDPMLRSGLALSGANAKASPGGIDDGILTALEASTLNLTATQLVVLSACDTGVGEIAQGEGVLGLRRAFALAGARSLVMSLWNVSDTATSRWMESYYRRLQAGAGRSAALREVQLEFLSDPVLRDPYYWAPFIVSGETGPLSAPLREVRR